MQAVDAAEEVPLVVEPPPVGRAALSARWPELDVLPWRNIVESPTPLLHVVARDSEVGSFWVKQDAESAPGYGGSKPRKLEPLLGAALRAGVEEVCTFGALGSNHVAATAVHGRRVGLAVRAYVLPGPLDEHGRRNLQICKRAGARLISAPSQTGAQAMARRWLGKRPPESIFPWGGTSPVGNLGCVAALLELAHQVDAPPDYVFVAGGTLGTAVGLEVGLRLVRWPTQLVVMRASNRAPYTQARFQVELDQTTRILSKLVPQLGEQLAGEAPRIDASQLGSGYARATSAGRQARAFFLEHTGFPLDLTYTGKAFAGLLARAPQLAGKRVLFWQTLDPDPAGI